MKIVNNSLKSLPSIITSAISFTTGLALNATPNPAFCSIDMSFAPSPTAAHSSVDNFTVSNNSCNMSALEPSTNKGPLTSPVSKPFFSWSILLNA